MNIGPKKVTFAKYNLKKWTMDVDYKKTKRMKEPTEIIDMREKNIEEELVNKHEETYTKKELCDKRMASRDLAIQGLCNPFMFKNDYVSMICKYCLYLHGFISINNILTQLHNTILSDNNKPTTIAFLRNVQDFR